MKKFAGISAFIGAMVLGFVFFASSFEYVQKRSTASVKSNYDFTCLTGIDLSNAILNRIVTGIATVRKDGLLGIKIGHFTYSDSEEDRKSFCGNTKDRKISNYLVPNRKMACELYPKMSLHFVADGESSSGDKRSLDIETPCKVSTDLSQTETVWIPWKKLAQESPFEGVTEYSKPTKVTIKTHNINFTWPEKWILEAIELEGEKDTLKVDASQIKEIAGRPLIFDFN
jgi:hypothetical protein